MLKTASFAQYSGTQALLSTRLEMCLEYIDYPGSEKSKYNQYNKDFGVQQSGSDESVFRTGLGIEIKPALTCSFELQKLWGIQGGRCL